MITSKAQLSWEYLLIVGLALGVIVPTAYLFFTFSSESNEQILDTQIDKIGRDIIDTAETVYFSGEGSKIVLDVTMPENVVDVYIKANRELVFKTTTELGEVERVFFSSPGVDITSGVCDVDGNCELTDLASAGLNKIKIQSGSDGKVKIEKFDPTATTLPGPTTTTSSTLPGPTTTTTSTTTTTTTTTTTLPTYFCDPASECCMYLTLTDEGGAGVERFSGYMDCYINVWQGPDLKECRSECGYPDFPFGGYPDGDWEVCVDYFYPGEGLVHNKCQPYTYP